MVVKAKPDDIGRCVDLLGRAAVEMGYSETGLTYDKESVRHTLITNIDRLFVCDGGVAGYIVAPSIMNYAEVTAIEFCWHSDPNIKSPYQRAKIMMALLRAMEAEVKKTGIERFVVSSGYKHPSVSKMLTRNGYTAREIAHSKGVMSWV